MYESFAELLITMRSSLQWHTEIKRNMTNSHLIELIERRANEYRHFAIKSLLDNAHMNGLKIDEIISQTHIDAILVDFLNYLAGKQGIDLGFCTHHLK